ncbi:NAD-dependent epimerase/dehydratase family protein [Ornithinimicrobium sp. Arc0846-15]|nr:NAD-dependent epimerase/dehydratase family protein [Ornithinimicrobium laminariae]
MKVLVTGASGMLGGTVADLLAERGDDVTVMQRRAAGGKHRERLGDISSADDVDRAVADHDAIIHLAAKVNVTGRWADYQRTNIGGTQNIVEAAQRHGVRRLVQVSSPSVAHSGRSISGDGANPADPHSARGNYARSKAAAELLALAAHSDELAVTAVRPHLVWGPGDTQLVGRIVARAKSGRLPLIGSGAALVDTTYVDNAASAIVAALDRAEHAGGRAWVVTNGEPRPIGELIGDICRASGAPAPTRRVPFALAYAAGALVESAMEVSQRIPGLPSIDEPPLTRFLAEQLSTAHWFDQRQTQAALAWKPHLRLAEGFNALSAASE